MSELRFYHGSYLRVWFPPRTEAGPSTCPICGRKANPAALRFIVDSMTDALKLQAVQPRDHKFVAHSSDHDASVTLFAYGNGWRVKFEKWSNDADHSRLLAWDDVEYTDFAAAHAAYQHYMWLLAETSLLQDASAA